MVSIPTVAFVPAVACVLTTPGVSENLPNSGRNFASFAANGQALQLDSDAIAEVKVLTSSYQAEFGRMSGLQITGVTKSVRRAYTWERRSRYISFAAGTYAVRTLPLC